MKIVLIPASYHPILGGLQMVAGSLAREFSRKDNQILVVARRYPRTLLAKEIVDGIPVHRLDFICAHSQHLLHLRLDLFVAGLWYERITTVRLKSLLDRTTPDLIHLHFVGDQTELTLRTLRERHTPLVVTIHGDDVEGLNERSRNQKKVFRDALRMASAVTAPSRYLLNQMLAYVPETRVKAVVIPNGIDVDVFASAKKYQWPRPYIFASGRLVKKKGFDVLIEAYAATDLSCDLLIAGEGEEGSWLRTRVSQLGLSGKVHFVGRVDIRTIASLLVGARLFVIPSLLEPFGIVALEARAIGVPIVASNVGGLPEVLAGANTTFVFPGAIDELADAIQARMWDTRVERRRSTIPPTFAWSDVAEQYLRLYESLLNRGQLQEFR